MTNKTTIEVNDFIEKYIWNKEKLNVFLRHLSPNDCEMIVRGMLEKGMVFTWEEPEGTEERQLTHCIVKRKKVVH